MKTLLKIAAVCLPMLVLSPLAISPAHAQVRFGADIHIGDPAPPPPREIIVERPYPEAIWVPGYYNYNVWTPGFWRHPHYAERGYRGYYGRGYEGRRFEGREFEHRDFDRGHDGRRDGGRENGGRQEGGGRGR